MHRLRVADRFDRHRHWRKLVGRQRTVTRRHLVVGVFGLWGCVCIARLSRLIEPPEAPPGGTDLGRNSNSSGPAFQPMRAISLFCPVNSALTAALVRGFAMSSTRGRTPRCELPKVRRQSASEFTRRARRSLSCPTPHSIARIRGCVSRATGSPASTSTRTRTYWPCLLEQRACCSLQHFSLAPMRLPRCTDSHYDRNRSCHQWAFRRRYVLKKVSRGECAQSRDKRHRQDAFRV